MQFSCDIIYKVLESTVRNKKIYRHKDSEPLHVNVDVNDDAKSESESEFEFDDADSESVRQRATLHVTASPSGTRIRYFEKEEGMHLGTVRSKIEMNTVHEKYMAKEIT